MEFFLQAIAWAVLGAIASLVLKSQGGHFAPLVAIGCACGMLFLAAKLLEPLLDLLDALRLAGGLSGEYVGILLKIAGVGILTEIAQGVCEDAGQGVLGKMARLCGAVAAFYLSIPLLQRTLELIQEILLL